MDVIVECLALVEVGKYLQRTRTSNCTTRAWSQPPSHRAPPAVHPFPLHTHRVNPSAHAAPHSLAQRAWRTARRLPANATLRAATPPRGVHGALCRLLAATWETGSGATWPPGARAPPLACTTPADPSLDKTSEGRWMRACNRKRVSRVCVEDRPSIQSASASATRSSCVVASATTTFSKRARKRSRERRRGSCDSSARTRRCVALPRRPRQRQRGRARCFAPLSGSKPPVTSRQSPIARASSAAHRLARPAVFALQTPPIAVPPCSPWSRYSRPAALLRDSPTRRILSARAARALTGKTLTGGPLPAALITRLAFDRTYSTTRSSSAGSSRSALLRTQTTCFRHPATAARNCCSDSVNGRSDEVTKRTRSARGRKPLVSAVCASSIELVPGVSTRCIDLSHSTPGTSITVMPEAPPSRANSSCPAGGSNGTSGCLIRQTDAVVGSTPSAHARAPSSPLMSADFPALNSPTTHARKSESSVVRVSCRTSTCSGAA
eukprot:scaffold41058_cov29-Tisochrysis_lutea.AAC.2